MTGIIINVGKRAYNFLKTHCFQTFSVFSGDAAQFPLISVFLITAKTGLKSRIHPGKTLLKD